MCEGVCSGSVRECVVCVRVCEGACTKVQCVYKWCVRECGCVRERVQRYSVFTSGV